MPNLGFFAFSFVITVVSIGMMSSIDVKRPDEIRVDISKVFCFLILIFLGIFCSFSFVTLLDSVTLHEWSFCLQF